MAALVLTAICLSGLALATALALRWGGEQRLPPPQPESDGHFLREFARTATVGVVGGTVAGVLVAGLGGRLVMRLLAATSGDAAQGLMTEAEEQVGRISTGGTVGLVIFVGLFGGIFGGMLYALVRRWLPPTAAAAGLIFGVLLLGLARLDPLSPENRDFAILQPQWLAVLLIAAIFPAYGVVAAATIEHLNRVWPRHPAAFLPLLIVVPAPPVALGIILAGAVGVLARRAGGLRPSVLAGRCVLAALGVAGLAWTGAGAVSILT